MVESGRRFPVIGPVTLPDAPTMGAEAGAAQWFAERLEDVRVAGALLPAAAEHVDLAVNTTRHIKFLPPEAQPRWVRRLIAAREPLQRIIEACAAFEDVLADGEPGSQDDAGHGDRQSEKARSQPATQPSQAVELVLPNDMRDVPADIARSATFVVPIAREDQIVDRRLPPRLRYLTSGPRKRSRRS